MEKLAFGIPAILTAEGINEYGNRRTSPLYSKWPVPLGIACTFDPECARGWGQSASREYRAVGVNVALEPQADIASEPRWNRFWQTFGESSRLIADMTRAFVDGLQTASEEKEIADGWGYDSVCAVTKHFPGGGTGEAGRDSHFNYGKFAVYPGDRFRDHLEPFREGVLKLDGPTKYSAYIMPYYTISYSQDTLNGENVGNGFSEFILQELLRKELGYRGGIFSDFGILRKLERGAFMGGKPWGVEELSSEARHLKSIRAGMSIFGKGDDWQGIQEAVNISVERWGEEETFRMLRDAVRYRLVYQMKQGLFENPYLDPEESRKVLPLDEASEAGYQAQLKSIVLLKNDGVLPVKEKKKVYIPRQSRRDGAYLDLKFATVTTGSDALRQIDPVEPKLVKQWFEPVENPEDADFALVFMDGPDSGYGWSREDLSAGGNGYLPISLQYRPYRAVNAREHSIAGGDIYENFTNRTYRGKTVTAENESDLDMLLRTRHAMGSKPVIVSLTVTRPVVPAEFEPYADAILLNCRVDPRAVLDTVAGISEPSGLLPMQLPADMETVENQQEDVPFDMRCYTDSLGNTYDFGFGLNFSGVIRDARTIRYCAEINS